MGYYWRNREHFAEMEPNTDTHFACNDDKSDNKLKHRLLMLS